MPRSCFLVIVLTLYFSVSARAETADDIWGRCIPEQIELCRQRAGFAANMTPRACVDDVNEYCKLTVKRACAEKNGNMSGCSRFGISETFANFPEISRSQLSDDPEGCVPKKVSPVPSQFRAAEVVQNQNLPHLTHRQEHHPVHNQRHKTPRLKLHRLRNQKLLLIYQTVKIWRARRFHSVPARVAA